MEVHFTPEEGRRMYQMKYPVNKKKMLFNCGKNFENRGMSDETKQQINKINFIRKTLLLYCCLRP